MIKPNENNDLSNELSQLTPMSIIILRFNVNVTICNLSCQNIRQAIDENSIQANQVNQNPINSNQENLSIYEMFKFFEINNIYKGTSFSAQTLAKPCGL